MARLVEQEQSRRRRAVVRITSAVAVVAMLLGFPNAASALWSATSSTGAVLETAVIPAPTNVTCTTHPPVLLIAGYVTIAWLPVHVDSGSVSYRIYVGDSGNPLTTTSATSIELRAGLLESLIPHLLALLLGGQTVPVQVETVHSSSWVSEKTEADRLITGYVVNNLRCV